MEVKPKIPRIDIVEDNLKISQNVMKFISFHDDFEVGESFGSAEAFLYKLEHNPQDLNLLSLIKISRILASILN